jgi:CCR4-NOT transcriptional regulation complex NOT5 subunit
MVDLNKVEVGVLTNYLQRNLRYFRENNLEKQFWNDAYHIDELETILEKLKNAKVQL